MSQLLGLFVEEFGDLSIILAGLQGLVGSGPQIVLQLVVVLHMRPPGPIQILVFIIGILLIGKSVVQYDVLYKEGTTNRNVNISIGRKLRYSLLVSPIYLSSMIFRMGALIILIGYLGYLAILPIILHVLLVCVVASLLRFEKKDILILACTNTCIMSVGPLKTADVSHRQSRFKFIFYSSLLSFIMFSVFIISLVYVMNMDIKIMPHWNILLLSRCGNILPFNIICVNILQAGVVNLLLLCTSQWGRLDSYMDRGDMEDIMDNMKDRYKRTNVSFFAMSLQVGPNSVGQSKILNALFIPLNWT